MKEVQETIKTLSEMANSSKEAWNQPTFEEIGVDATANSASPGDDGLGVFTAS